MPTFTIDVSANGQISKSEDHDVCGKYMVTIIDVDINASQKKIVSCALDAFHESIPIRVLDDFSISVLDDNNIELAEDENHVTYSYKGNSIVEKIDIPISKVTPRPRM